MTIEIHDGLWHYTTDEKDWVYTPLNEILVSVHLNSGETTMTLTMLVDLIAPLIAAKLDQSLSASLHDSSPLGSRP